MSQLDYKSLDSSNQMVAIVSHDIKNPLSAIQLEAQMLLRAAERAEKSFLTEEVKLQANRILKTTERMKLLVSDLLDNHKSVDALSQLMRQEVSVVELLIEALDFVAPLLQEKEISLKKFVPESLVVLLDRNKIFQVFTNLISNALKFTPRGGEISVSMEERSGDFYFQVEDSGPGLPTQNTDQIFQKYWSGPGEAHGTGLGLYICRTIIEAHGGKIFAENNHKQGARFFFIIPKELRSCDENSLGKQVMIVDDDEDLREVISWVLLREGYSTLPLGSAYEALFKLAKPGSKPKLIIMDFHLDSMNGEDFIKMKNELPLVESCPVIMMTASPEIARLRMNGDHIQELLPKPIDFEGLVSAVRKFLQ